MVLIIGTHLSYQQRSPFSPPHGHKRVTRSKRPHSDKHTQSSTPRTPRPNIGAILHAKSLKKRAYIQAAKQERQRSIRRMSSVSHVSKRSAHIVQHMLNARFYAAFAILADKKVGFVLHTNAHTHTLNNRLCDAFRSIPAVIPELVLLIRGRKVHCFIRCF